MIAEISSLIASSKTAYDIAKGLTSVYVDDKVRERTSELVGILLAVQGDALAVNTQHQELLQEKYNLEKKILEFEQWNATKNNYEIKELAPGIIAYLRKKTDESINFAVWICPYCYDQKKESFLQRKGHSEDAGSYLCPSCKTLFQWGPMKIITRKTLSKGITDGYL
jgi:hypothetical protein